MSKDYLFCCKQIETHISAIALANGVNVSDSSITLLRMFFISLFDDICKKEVNNNEKNIKN